MDDTINLLQKKILAIYKYKYDPGCIQQGKIIEITDVLVKIIDDDMYEQIFNTDNVNKLKYGTYYSLGLDNFILFLSKLHKANIEFSYNYVMTKTPYFITGGNSLTTFDKIFDYLYNIGEFDSYEFIYNAYTSIHILKIIKLNYQIDYIRLINVCLRANNEEIIKYLLECVDDTRDINIEYMMKYGQNMIMINEFISRGTNIEVLHCLYDNYVIRKLFDHININNIHLIRKIYMTKHTYADLLFKTPAVKIDELLSHGCAIFFIDAEDNKLEPEQVTDINNKNIEFDNKFRVFEAHNIDLQFIIRHYLLDGWS